MSLLLAVDVGTRAARAGLFDAAGALVATASADLELHHPAERHAVYVMDEIWRAVREAVRTTVALAPEASRALAGIAFDATSSLVLNHTGQRPLEGHTGKRPLEGNADVLCWMDHRGEAEAERITATGDRALRYIGGALSPELHLAKLLWLREHDPDAWARLTGVRDLCDELARRATGASHHSLCRIACKWPYLPNDREPWRCDLLERLGLGNLPALGSLAEAPRMVGAVHGALSVVAAAELGVPVGIPVAVGLIDAEAGMLGTLGRYALQATIPHLTRSSLHRCLQHHGISRLPDIEGGKPARKKFKPYPIGFFHIDIAEVQTAEGKLYLFVAIDRTSEFAFVQLVDSANRVTASAFLVALIKAVPYKIHTILTDNGIQFRFAPRYADGPTARYMTHMFDMRCREDDIEHRFTKINHPWTNGEVERMNRTSKEAAVKRFHYETHDALRAHLANFVAAYNFANRLKTLKDLTPYEYVCSIWTKEPGRFTLNPLHQMPGLNT